MVRSKHETWHVTMPDGTVETFTAHESVSTLEKAQLIANRMVTRNGTAAGCKLQRVKE